MWNIGDVLVQYLTLDMLPLEGGHGDDNNNDEQHSGDVLQVLALTRKDVAYALQIPEELMLKSFLVMGNDYTN